MSSKYPCTKMLILFGEFKVSDSDLLSMQNRLVYASNLRQPNTVSSGRIRFASSSRTSQREHTFAALSAGRLRRREYSARDRHCSHIYRATQRAVTPPNTGGAKCANCRALMAMASRISQRQVSQSDGRSKINLY